MTHLQCRANGFYTVATCMYMCSGEYPKQLINLSLIIFLISLANTTELNIPTLEDLYEVAKQYATYWKEIGVELKLSPKDLHIIENEYAYKPLPCCLAMIKKWLKLDPDVSWPKWYKVLSSVENTGMHTYMY